MIPKLHNNSKRKTAESAVNRAFLAVCFCIIFGNYIDDGYSGTDFSRPGVTALLDDAKEGKINFILCKNLSRFGRNYIMIGQYLDYLFPMYNIRFIALTDNVDTLNNNSASMDMLPIMNVFNEQQILPKNCVQYLRVMQSRENTNAPIVSTVILRVMTALIRQLLTLMQHRLSAIFLR